VLEVFGNGRLTRDPESKVSQNGNTICNFTLACDGFGKDDQGNRKVSFLSCVAFGKTGEIIMEHCAQGDMIIFAGRMEQRKWTAQDGTKRDAWSCTINEFTFGARKQNGGQQAAPATPAPAPAGEDDEDPFGDE
jgi:single-strand DNA-binding protein